MNEDVPGDFGGRIGAVYRFPVTGQPLPLVSMGGTSLLFTSASFGMILSVSHTFSEEGEREEKEKLKMAAQGINEEEENEEN